MASLYFANEKSQRGLNEFGGTTNEISSSTTSSLSSSSSKRRRISDTDGNDNDVDSTSASSFRSSNSKRQQQQQQHQQRGQLLRPPPQSQQQQEQHYRHPSSGNPSGNVSVASSTNSSFIEPMSVVGNDGIGGQNGGVQNGQLLGSLGGGSSRSSSRGGGSGSGSASPSVANDYDDDHNKKQQQIINKKKKYIPTNNNNQSDPNDIVFPGASSSAVGDGDGGIQNRQVPQSPPIMGTIDNKGNAVIGYGTTVGRSINGDDDDDISIASSLTEQTGHVSAGRFDHTPSARSLGQNPPPPNHPHFQTANVDTTTSNGTPPTADVRNVNTRSAPGTPSTTVGVSSSSAGGSLSNSSGDNNNHLNAPVSVSAGSNNGNGNRTTGPGSGSIATSRTNDGRSPTTTAEETGNDKRKSSSRQSDRVFLLCLCIMCCLFVGGGVGAGVGIALARNKEAKNAATVPVEIPSNDDKNNNDGIGDDGGGASTSGPQPHTASPTSGPIKDNGGGGKDTDNPTPSQTAAPVTLPPIPVNDQCIDAIGISTSGAVPIFGYTISATAHPELASIPGVNCDLSTADGPAVWYLVAGTGLVLTATTCNNNNSDNGGTTGAGDTDYDSKLAIVQPVSADDSNASGGSGNPCDELQCITSDDDGMEEGCGLASSVTWLAELGSIYYIVVTGFNGASGNFRLSVGPQPLENDTCQGAIPITEIGGFTAGSTIAATVEDSSSIPSSLCGTQIEAPGVWYQVQGTGTPMIFTTCHDTLYDSKISIYSGTCPSGGDDDNDNMDDGNTGLICEGGNDDFCRRQSRVEIDSVLDETYYILIHGFNRETGPFQLHVATPETLYNNDCIDATLIQPNDDITLIGNNIYARFDFRTILYCNENVQISGPTVWYQVIGTGGLVSISTCHPELTDYDTQVSIFRGTCTGFVECVDGNDDSFTDEDICDRSSQISWRTDLFENYLIAVHGYENATGTFGLSLTEIEPPPSYDSCLTAAGPIPYDIIFSVPFTIQTSVDASTLGCGNTVDSLFSVPGIWISVLADGGTITASIDCSEEETNDDDDDFRIYVLQGDCSVGLECIDSSSIGQCSISWMSEESETYYLFIQGPDEGHYDLSVSSTGPPTVSNDLCINAISVPLNNVDNPIQGSTTRATADTDAGMICDETITAPSVWYSLIGTDEDVLIRLCDNTNFDTIISIYRSMTSSCDDLVCIGTNDNSCGLQSEFLWFAQFDVTYYILVHGFDQNNGDFELTAITLAS